MKVNVEGIFDNEGIREIELSQEQVIEFDNRTAPILENWKKRNYSNGCTLSLLGLCRDCYMQGLIDGSDQDILELVEEERRNKNE